MSLRHSNGKLTVSASAVDIVVHQPDYVVTSYIAVPRLHLLAADCASERTEEAIGQPTQKSKHILPPDVIIHIIYVKVKHWKIA